ncbi:MAG: endonuclease [Rhodobacteraceae bacterium]|jgi:endonuclease/exonuclease/phosphatase family metal-dependent hydrolase|uniref:endonuclease/exonuclease/phosphatase family protein n=1 Tax=Albidovulum sp. TaxID=1872424 RepID=UPI001D266508|nr:endonuclease/exonuclease/phosphatase family protein [uncultured Defluviimonas sp.]MCB2124482.1 endonuclease [Paracoccaceae bacterium]MCC0068875.1 endonuclease [Paracoccaceae bacterium]
MRLATYNVEWFSNLFDRNGVMLEDGGWSARYNVTRADQLGSLGIVFTAMDADAVMIIEAPDNNRRHKTVAMLEAFAARYGLRTRKALLGYENETQQEIALLYDPDKLSAEHDPIGLPDEPVEGVSTPRFDTSYRIDLNIDRTLDTVRFSKPPLEVAVTTAAGARLRLIGVHVKSKAPHGAESEAQVKRLAIENRRKQLAQCIWLRERVLEHLRAKESLIVMGDFNDGPGIDEYEKLFGRSGVEIVLGWDEPHETRLFDPHARVAFGKKLAAMPSTARFYLDDKGAYFSALLDYIMVSPDIRAKGPKWRIWHPFDDPGCYRVPELREALLTASDHFPVTIDVDL